VRHHQSRSEILYSSRTDDCLMQPPGTRRRISSRRRAGLRTSCAGAPEASRGNQHPSRRSDAPGNAFPRVETVEPLNATTDTEACGLVSLEEPEIAPGRNSLPPPPSDAALMHQLEYS
jgi:hypothetical protein